MKFCNNCNNILYIKTSGDELTFECKVCLNTIEGNPSDTLICDVKINNTEDIFVKYESFINLCIRDNTLPRVMRDCSNPECKETIMKYAILGNDMQYLYICES